MSSLFSWNSCFFVLFVQKIFRAVKIIKRDVLTAFRCSFSNIVCINSVESVSSVPFGGLFCSVFFHFHLTKFQTFSCLVCYSVDFNDWVDISPEMYVIKKEKNIVDVGFLLLLLMLMLILL